MRTAANKLGLRGPSRTGTLASSVVEAVWGLWAGLELPSEADTEEGLADDCDIAKRNGPPALSWSMSSRGKRMVRLRA